MPNIIFGQFDPKFKPAIDSMRSELERNDIHDTTRLNLEFTLAQTMWNLRLGFWDSLAVKSHNALKQAENKEVEKRLKELELGCYNNIGYIHLGNGDSELALESYDKAKVIAEEIGDEDGIATYYGSKGVIHLRRGELDQAIVSYDKSLKLREKLGDKGAISNSLNNLGFIYDRQGEFDIALKYYENSLSIRREIDDKKGISTCLNNIGQIYVAKGDHEKALVYYQEALEIRKLINYKRGIATVLTNIGSIFKMRGELDSALAYYNNALIIREETGDKKGISTSCVYVGGIYLDRGQLPKSIEYAKRGFEVAQQIGYPLQIKNGALLLSKIYNKQGNNGKALEFYKLHIQMRDSINSEENQRATIAQEAKYVYEKQKAIDDAEHDKQLAIEQEAKEKQKILTYATGLGLILVGVFLIFVFSRLKITRKQKAIIEQAHNQLEEKNQEILDSITYAKRIQSAILPSTKSVKEKLSQSFILYKPKDVVAGDFYWMEQKAEKIQWIVSDILDFQPNQQYDLWHDRAVFHFLTESEDIDSYVELVSQSVKKNGYFILATFSKSGPLKCSGLEISQYDKQTLLDLFNAEFNLIKSFEEVHHTPFNSEQNFIYSLFKKK